MIIATNPGAGPLIQTADLRPEDLRLGLNRIDEVEGQPHSSLQIPRLDTFSRGRSLAFAAWGLKPEV
jgi:hypothetical protein